MTVSPSNGFSLKEFGVIPTLLNEVNSIKEQPLRISKLFLKFFYPQESESVDWVIPVNELSSTIQIKDFVKQRCVDLKNTNLPLTAIEAQFFFASTKGAFGWWAGKFSVSEKAQYSNTSLVAREYRDEVQRLQKNFRLECISFAELFPGKLFDEYQAFREIIRTELSDYLQKKVPQSFVPAAFKVHMKATVDLSAINIDGTFYANPIPNVVVNLMDAKSLDAIAVNSIMIDLDLFIKSAADTYIWIEYKKSIHETPVINPSFSLLQDQAALLENYRIFKSLSDDNDEEADVLFLYKDGFVQGDLILSQNTLNVFWNHCRQRVTSCQLL